MIYVLSQIIGFIAFLFSIVAYHLDKKEKILNKMRISSIINFFHYLLLGAYSGCITKILAILRDTIIIKKEKNKTLNSYYILFLLVILYVIASIITYTNIYSILPLLAAIIYLLFIWNGDKKRVKKIAFFTYFMWLIYNICVLSISGIISNIVSIISTLIAVINIKKEN